jgi:hypothetical protein
MTAKLFAFALSIVITLACVRQARAVVFDDNIFFRPGDASWSLSHNPGAPDFYVAPPAFAPVTAGPVAFGVANSSDVPMLGDVDGNGLDDIVIIRPGAPNFTWFAGLTKDTDNDGTGELLAGGASISGPFGVVAGSEGNFLADFNGDGTDDMITINGGFTWFGLGSANGGLGGGIFTTTPFGVAGDQPFVGDFNADGTDDLGLYRVATGDIFILDNTGGGFGGGGVTIAGPFGAGQDSVLVGRLNNDDFDDLMLLRQDGVDNIEWLPLLNDGAGNFQPDFPFLPFGLDNGGDIPFLADIDGDGIDDIGVTRNGLEHFVLLSGSATLENWNFGQTGDIHLFGQFNIPEPNSMVLVLIATVPLLVLRTMRQYE